MCVTPLILDDTLFLLQADSRNLRNANCILNFFTMCSGLKVNMGKGSLAEELRGEVGV